MLALSTRRTGRAARRLGPAAAVARGLGFASLHAATPPSDAETARASLEEFGLVLVGVATEPVAGLRTLDAAVDRAAEAARLLRQPRVVVDLGRYVAAGKEAPEAAVDALARALHGAYGRFGGIALAVRPGARAGTLFGLVETEWLLDALAGKGLSAWLDPAGSMGAASAPSGESLAAATPLDWADRLARRTLGISLPGPGPTAEGRAPPEDGAIDWSTLRGMLPAGAIRVLDVGPEAGDAEVVDARRRFEERLGF